MKFPRLDELTESFKILQPMPDSFDEEKYLLIVEKSIEKIINDVVVYINVPVDKLPPELDSALLFKLSGWFTDSGVFMPENERHSGPVTSITEGDTQINYGSPQNALQTLSNMSFIDNDFKSLLNRYRRIRGGSMSDPFREAGAILATLYRDRVTIYGAKPVVRNGATELQDVVIVSNYPCKISLNNQQPSADVQYGTDEYDAKLFIDNTVTVPAGSVIEVTDINGHTTRYKRSSSGYTAYASHQELTMIRDEKATVKTDG